MSLFNDIQDLKAKQASTQLCQDFLQQHNWEQLFDEFNKKDQYTAQQLMEISDVINCLLMNENIFESFFFTNRNQQLIINILQQNDLDLLPHFSASIFKNRQIVISHLNEYMTSNTMFLEESLSVIFYLFMNEEIEVGCRIGKTLVSFSEMNEMIPLFQNPKFIQLILDTLKSKESIIRMRGMELVKDITKNPTISQIMDDAQIIDYCIYLFEKSNDDILEKLNVIEILKDWIMNKHIQKIFQHKNLFQRIKSDALEEEDDYYLKRDLICIVLCLYNSLIEQYDTKFMEKIFEFTKKMLKLYPEDKQGGIEICMYLFQSIENIDILIKDSSFILLLKDLENQKDFLMEKYHGFLRILMDPKKISLKERKITFLSEDHVKTLVKIFFTNNKNQILSEDDLKQGLQNLIKKCYVPFKNQQVHHITILKNILNYPKFIEVLFNFEQSDEFLYFLQKKILNDNEVNQLKQDISNHIIKQIEELTNVSPAVREQILNAINKQQQKAQDQNLEVHTEVQ